MLTISKHILKAIIGFGIIYILYSVITLCTALAYLWVMWRLHF